MDKDKRKVRASLPHFALSTTMEGTDPRKSPRRDSSAKKPKPHLFDVFRSRSKAESDVGPAVPDLRSFTTALTAHEKIPSIVINAIHTISQNDGLKTKGLFRESAPASLVEEQIKNYESGKDIKWDELKNMHLVGGILMTFLLRMPEPLITFDTYDSMIAVEETKDFEKQLQVIKILIESLPPIHRLTLQVLTRFLAEMSTHSCDNMMTPDNLGIVFGPALLRKQEETIVQILHDSPIIIRVISNIIQQQDVIFEEAKSQPPKAPGRVPPPSRKLLRKSSTFAKLTRNGDGVFAEQNDEEMFLQHPRGSTIDAKSLLQYSVGFSLHRSKTAILELLNDLSKPAKWDDRSLSSLCIFSNTLKTVFESPCTALSFDDLRIADENGFDSNLFVIRTQGKEAICQNLDQYIRQLVEELEGLVTASQAAILNEEVANYNRISRNTKLLVDYFEPKLVRYPEVDVNHLLSLISFFKGSLDQLRLSFQSLGTVPLITEATRTIRSIKKSFVDMDASRYQAPSEAILLSLPDVVIAKEEEKNRVKAMEGVVSLLLDDLEDTLLEMESNSRFSTKNFENSKNLEVLECLRPKFGQMVICFSSIPKRELWGSPSSSSSSSPPKRRPAPAPRPSRSTTVSSPSSPYSSSSSSSSSSPSSPIASPSSPPLQKPNAALCASDPVTPALNPYRPMTKERSKVCIGART